MSYILDAIKKAESQRRQDKVPTLEDIVASGRKPKKTFPWKSVVTVLALVTVVAAAYWYRQPITTAVGNVYERIGQYASSTMDRFFPGEEETVTDAGPVPEEPASEDTPPEPTRAGNKQVSGVLKAVSSKKSGNKSSGSQNQSAPQKKADNRFTPEIQQQLDSLGFSVLSYSTDPAQRFVMVGSKVLREGDYLGDFRILHIVRGGVMVDVNGHDYLVQP